MDRRGVASGLAAVAGVSFVAAQALVGVADYPSWREIVPGVGALTVAVAIPLVGAVLVARHRWGGVAVLVSAALVGVPGLMSLGSLLASSPAGDVTAHTILLLAAQLSIVGAGIAAWGLHDAERWRWDRPVLLPFAALAIVVVLPIGVRLVAMHGVLFPIAILANLNVWDLAWLAHLTIMVGLLIWAARLPRRSAAVVLLVLLVPRLFSALDMLLTRSAVGGMTTEPFTRLGMAAEAALIAHACWWLTRDDDDPIRTDDVARGTRVTR